MIKFITEEEQHKNLTFDMVEQNQFFINNYGQLCQKVSAIQYGIIAEEDGRPYSSYSKEIHSTTPIEKILPIVSKIKF